MNPFSESRWGYAQGGKVSQPDPFLDQKAAQEKAVRLQRAHSDASILSTAAEIRQDPDRLQAVRELCKATKDALSVLLDAIG